MLMASLTSDKESLGEIIHPPLTGRPEGLFEGEHDKAERKYVLQYLGSAENDKRSYDTTIHMYR